eukprot:CAMPEP_0174381626 /NCGR_PEP_ID=MMETSP0811_2-20130205/124139_1 /TAXON_ID=73025 ORGANISM="Eutreptiella gymnastica-like, Strain CCMP1594" /NCGR_SAMPLE_ID=MMETSP0811_2 /ASSEMBLY_ACC=CAM_ASM_000667 /LENGTH=73 /DNA_ID=CAMNT_0015534833 /DNA_START=464 /DNA_END=685 /DNA_ORIENTATION=+
MPQSASMKIACCKGKGRFMAVFSVLLALVRSCRFQQQPNRHNFVAFLSPAIASACWIRRTTGGIASVAPQLQD